MLEVHKIEVTHLANIAATLSQLLAGQEKLNAKMSNGLSLDIKEMRQHGIDVLAAARAAESYSRVSAWIVGGVCGIVALAEVILHVVTKTHP